LQNIRAITFDLDDTLWEIGPVIRRAEALLWQWLEENYPRIPLRWEPQALVELRRSMFDEFPDMVHDFRFMRKTMLERIALESGYSADLVESAIGIFDAARNEVELYPEVLSELKWFAERFVVIAITNGNANLHTIGIADLFDDIVTSVNVGVAKPARPIFDAAVRRAGVAPQETLHVGDHAESDIQGARDAGMRTVWVNRTSAEWPDHLDAPDATVDDISGVRELLQSANALGRN
jgi:FMN hydrolase / 5-amino-6-(5-phospho-D-ribitylamino)uracil phosphatase